ncbi:MAG: DUF975 family protein [Clostridia bacterium]|nr:DUF975 family protein [Clostridia bacterium]
MYGYEGLGLIMNIVLSPIYVGVALVFLRISRGQESRAGDMFTPISRFPKIAGLFLYVFIKTFLWTLLLIIPGIIAAYRYSQSFIIMAENPDIGIVAAVERSKQLMKGNKWRLFVLHLSFIGWAILACLTFGILLLWLNPYYMTTVSNFYNALLLERGTGLSLNNNGGGSQTQSGGFYDRGDDRNDGRGGDKNGGFANDEKDAFDRSGDYGRGGYYEDKDADEKNDW